MGATRIPYLTRVWNPTEGCSPCSPGCEHCWAAAQAKRFRGDFAVKLHPERIEEPLHWRKPQRVGVAFGGDLFHEDVPSDFILHVFDWLSAMDHESCQYHREHQFLVLTKRTKRAMDVLFGPPDWEFGGGDFLKNTWIGTTVESAAQSSRWEALLETWVGHKWLSVEPLLGPLTLPTGKPWERFEWVVIGGESGPGARPCDLGWIREIVAQCRELTIPVWVKQMGTAWAKNKAAVRMLRDTRVRHNPNAAFQSSYSEVGGAGQRPEYWPEDLRVREYPPELVLSWEAQAQ